MRIGHPAGDGKMVKAHHSIPPHNQIHLFRPRRPDRESVPECEYPEIDSKGNRVVWGSRIAGLEIQHNRLLGMGWGLSGRYRFSDVSDPKSEISSTVNRDEHLAEIGLKWVHENGWSARAKESYRLLNFTANRTTENIWITDLEAGYEFPGKKGSVQLKVDNLFDAHFNWVTDPFVFQGRNPAREIFLTLNLSF